MRDLLEDKQVKIRKPQKCWGCARAMPKETIMHYMKQVDNGEFSASYWCPTCQKYWVEVMDIGDEIGFGDLRGEDRERWEEFRQKVEV